MSQRANDKHAFDGFSWMLGRPWQAVQKQLDDQDHETIKLRIVEEDGEPKIGLRNYDTNRVNIVVVKNIIVEIRGVG